jgi:hypothetical protein
MRCWPLLCLAFAFAGSACDDDDGDFCHGNQCACGDRPRCTVDCPWGDCEAECGGTDRCDFTCTDGCDSWCHDTAYCESSCGDGCALACTRSDSCDLTCDADCDVRCASVSLCDVAVGPNSQVECTSLASCDVLCTGPCSVACASVGSCHVRCPDHLVRCGEGAMVHCAERCEAPL